MVLSNIYSKKSVTYKSRWKYSPDDQLRYFHIYIYMVHRANQIPNALNLIMTSARYFAPVKVLWHVSQSQATTLSLWVKEEPLDYFQLAIGGHITDNRKVWNEIIGLYFFLRLRNKEIKTEESHAHTKRRLEKHTNRLSETLKEKSKKWKLVVL